MIGFFIRDDQAAAVRKVYADLDDPGAPVVTNNIFEFEPRYGLRVLTTLQNADLEPDEHSAIESLVANLGEYLGRFHKDSLFEPPLPSPDDDQMELFDEE